MGEVLSVLGRLLPPLLLIVGAMLAWHDWGGAQALAQRDDTSGP